MSKPLPVGAVTYTSTSDEFGAGTTYMDESTGKKYVWVYNAGADAIAAGDVCGQATTGLASGYVSVTDATLLDITDGTTVAVLVAGVGVGAIAAASYGFLQCGGYSANITTGTGVPAGVPLICLNGAKVATDATNTHPRAVFGYSDAADTDALGTGWLTHCLYTTR